MALVCSVLTACGGGGGGSSTSPVTPGPALSIAVAAGTWSGVVPITYVLSGEASGATVFFSASGDGGTTWSGAIPATGCTPVTALGDGNYTYNWDSTTSGLSGAVLVRAQTASLSATASATLAVSNLTLAASSATLDAASASVTYLPLHRGAYDLSASTLGYSAQSGFTAAVRSVPVTSWRISVGRWADGPPTLFVPDSASTSTDPSILAHAAHEFYQGPNTLAGAADATNYHLAALDAVLQAVTATGAIPYLCFDYMPFSLADNQDPTTSANLLLSDPTGTMTYSNGIRTSPPADPAVYAAVVTNVVRHVTGTLASGWAYRSVGSRSAMSRTSSSAAATCPTSGMERPPGS